MGVNRIYLPPKLQARIHSKVQSSVQKPKDPVEDAKRIAITSGLVLVMTGPFGAALAAGAAYGAMRLKRRWVEKAERAINPMA